MSGARQGMQADAFQVRDAKNSGSILLPLPALFWIRAARHSLCYLRPPLLPLLLLLLPLLLAADAASTLRPHSSPPPPPAPRSPPLAVALVRGVNALSSSGHPDSLAKPDAKMFVSLHVKAHRPSVSVFCQSKHYYDDSQETETPFACTSHSLAHKNGERERDADKVRAATIARRVESWSKMEGERERVREADRDEQKTGSLKL